MTIEEFADVIHIDLIFRRHASQKNRYTACFEGSEIQGNKGDGFLCSPCGEGKTPAEALGQYVSQIKGKHLFVEIHGESRREFRIPKNLTVE